MLKSGNIQQVYIIPKNNNIYTVTNVKWLLTGHKTYV